MKHISEVIKTILPFKLDGIREMDPTERKTLLARVNLWLKAKYLGKVT